MWKEAPNATGNSLTRAKNEDRTIFIFCGLMSDMTRGTKKTGGSNKCYETGRLKHDTEWKTEGTSPVMRRRNNTSKIIRSKQGPETL